MLLSSETDTMAKKIFKKGLVQKTQGDIANRLDLSYVFQRLHSLSSPLSIQRGRVAIYKELKAIVSLFEKDKDFMGLIKQEDHK